MSWNLVSAHGHSSRNFAEIEASELCGCFHCGAAYGPDEVEEWIEEDDARTALCPSCGIDSVIGDRSGLPVTDAAFLAAMNTHWFAGAVSGAERGDA